MTNTFPNTTINTLTEFSMIAGSTQDLFFNIYNSGSALVDLTGATIKWRLAPYGQPTTILEIDAINSGSPLGQFKVSISGSNTASLSGKYTGQYSMTDISGSVFKQQGLILLIPALA
jgi:hypothetical protein